MKIHLGCGKKILPGYVNCDFQPCWGGKPDVCFDLLDRWPFEDGSVSEALAVHVWEHFYDWQHAHLAAEALRVLNNRGCLVLEMPDLKKSCRNFLEDESDVQYGYWSIYADPNAANGDPNQMHKSGWWPAKIEAFLKGQGFKRVTCSNPQHKGRKVRRDFRVEAWKA